MVDKTSVSQSNPFFWKGMRNLKLVIYEIPHFVRNDNSKRMGYKVVRRLRRRTTFLFQSNVRHSEGTKRLRNLLYVFYFSFLI